MQKLLLLAKMQIKNKIDVSMIATKRNKLFASIYSIIKVALITALIVILMKLSISLNIFSLVNFLPVNVVTFVFTIMEVLAIITVSFRLSEDLYFSKDNALLLTFPVGSNKVFLSKIIVFYIYELIRNMYYMFPLFLAYGIVSSFPVYYYLWMIFCLSLITLINVLLGAILSIFAMIISIILKKNRIVKAMFFLAVITGIIILVVSLINLIPTNLNIIDQWSRWFWKIKSFLENFTRKAYVFDKIVSLVVGFRYFMTIKFFTIETLYILLICFASIIILFGVCYIVSRPVFFKFSSLPFEYTHQTNIGIKSNFKVPKLLSALFIDIKLTLRDSKSFLNLLSVAIIMPISILLFNKIVSAMDTKLLGKYLAFSFNILIILLMLLSSNANMASKLSREGNSLYIVKTFPQTNITNIITKMFVNFVVMLLSLVASITILSLFMPFTVWNYIFLTVGLLFAYIAHLLLSVELDIMSPQNNEYSLGNVTSNKNENLSSVWAFVFSFIVSAVLLLLMYENINISFLKIMLICFAFLVFKIWTFGKKSKLYFLTGDKI